MRKLSLYCILLLAVTLFLSGGILKIPVTYALSCTEQNLSADMSQDTLRALLAQCDAETAAITDNLNTHKSQSQKITGEVNLLKVKIEKAKAEISSKIGLITKLGGEIGRRIVRIQSLDEKIADTHSSLGQIIRKSRELDQMPSIFSLFSTDTISEVYSDNQTFNSIDQSVRDALLQVRRVKNTTEGEKKNLEVKKTAEVTAKTQLETQKKQVEVSHNQQAQLLAQKNLQIKQDESDIAARKKQAGKILAALFSLRGQKGIPFEDAYRYAREASTKTGVRPAFILAILTQESSLGKNDGGCLVTDTSGTGVRVSTGEVISRVMKPGSVSTFYTLLANLGFDAKTKQVSCPIKQGGSYFGYGGAMGPSQFIPSTWVLYASKIASTLGVGTANPWNPQHAIMATALYVADLGAASSETRAACSYYGSRGSTCAYGRSVASYAVKLQKNIDFLKANQ